MTTFVVQGSPLGEFPLDMLRHDLAFPLAPNDAARIGALLVHDGSLTMKTALKNITIDGKVDITLGTHSVRNITPGRWESFGWKVIRIDGDRQ